MYSLGVTFINIPHEILPIASFTARQLTCILQVIPRLIFHFRLCAGTRVYFGENLRVLAQADRWTSVIASWVKLGNLELNLSIDRPHWEGVQHSVFVMVPQHSGHEANGSTHAIS